MDEFYLAVEFVEMPKNRICIHFISFHAMNYLSSCYCMFASIIARGTKTLLNILSVIV